MRIIRNYLLKECFSPFLICVSVLTFIFLLGYLPQLADKVINKNVPITTVFLVLLYNIPVLLAYTLPIAALSTVILTFGRFSADNEIIALRANGITLQKLLMPLVVCGILLSCFLLLLNDRIIPFAYYEQKRLLQETGAQNPAAAIEPGTFIDDFDGYILFVYRVERNRLFNIRIYQPQPDGKPTRTIVAQEGEFTPVPGENKIMMKLINGTSDEPDMKNPNNFYKINFKTSFMTLDFLKGSKKVERKPKSMSLKELTTNIASMKKQQINPLPLITEYHRKISWSFAPLLFILLGFPIAVVTHKRAKSANLILAVLFAAPYYLISIGCQALASQWPVAPILTMWLPNIVGGSIVIWLNYKLCAS